MEFWALFGITVTLGIPVIALALYTTLRVIREVRRQRAMALVFEEKLAAYRHAVDVAAE